MKVIHEADQSFNTFINNIFIMKKLIFVLIFVYHYLEIVQFQECSENLKAFNVITDCLGVWFKRYKKMYSIIMQGGYCTGNCSNSTIQQGVDDSFECKPDFNLSKIS